MPLVDLPADATLDPAPGSLMDLPAGAQLDAPPYKGAVLPFSTDSSGKAHFDPSAGIPGFINQGISALANAFTAPSDSLAGRITPSSGDQNTIDRALNFAAVTSPTSVASRAGEVMPGQIVKQIAPSVEQLKNVAGKGYTAARASGLEYSGDAVGQMARGIQSGLQSEQGIIEKTAPKTFAILDELGNPPVGGTANIAGIEAARRGLSGIKMEGGTEGLAAGHAVRSIDNFMSTAGDNSIATPPVGPATAEDVAATLRDARGNYSAAQRSNDITGALDRANTGFLDQAEARAHASHSGRNIDNSIRQRVASFLQSPQNVAGFSQPEIDALNKVVAGGPVQNSARFVGNLLGGGGGAGSMVTSAFGLGAGHYFGGPEGGEIGMLLGPGVGLGAKTLENALARRSINTADEVVRMNSPLARAMAAEGALMKPAIGRTNAVVRSVLPGMIAPQQPQPMSLAEVLARGA